MRPAGRSGEWQQVCTEAELAEGRFREFMLADQPCFVFRRRNRLFAYRNLCPHLGITLNWLPGQFMDSDHCFIHCANHGALFTPEAGDCIAGPCQGERLTPVAVRAHNGLIEARL